MTLGQTEHDVIVIGGGSNGLVTAAYLARAGLDVLVLERRHLVGGAAATEELFPGFHISTCSYLIHLLQDRVVKDLDLYRHGLRVLPIDPFRFFPLPDGRYLHQWQDESRTCGEYETFGAGDGAGYRRWLHFWTKAATLIHRYFLTEPPTIEELRADVRGTGEEALVERLLSGTMTALLDEYFVSDEAKASVVQTLDVKEFDRPGVLLGYATARTPHWMDPSGQGLAVGGMGALSLSVARAAEGFGAKIRVGADVVRILCDDRRAYGVVLADGQELRSRMVVSNADPKRTFLQLLPADHRTPTIRSEMERLDTDCGTMKLHTAVDELPDFSRHLGAGFDPRSLVMIRICPSTTYYRKSVEDAMAGKVSAAPIFDIQIPTVYDTSIAPQGKHIVSMWIRYEPVHPKGSTWDELRQGEGERLIDLFTEYAPNFRKSVTDWLLLTPVDIERRLNITDGNYHHTNHAPGQLLGNRLFSRGGYRTPIAGLYMCGAGTHPGGEVSGAPGHNAAQAILVDVQSAKTEAGSRAPSARTKPSSRP